MKRQNYIIFSLVAAAIATAVFVVQSSAGDKEKDNTNAISTNVATSTTATEELKPLFVPEGWKTYVSSNEWSNKGRIALTYPSNWEMEEEYQTIFKGKPNEYIELSRVSLIGDGYSLFIHQKAHGASSEPTIKSIDGYEARIYQEKIDTPEGTMYGTLIGVMGTGFIVNIRSLDKTNKIPEEILSTINFEVPKR